MLKLFIGFLRLPWWGYFFLAAGVLWLGEHTVAIATAERARIDAALAGPPPMMQALTDDLAHDPESLNEVVLRAQIDPSQTTNLIDTTNGSETSRHRMYVLLPPEATEAPQSYRTFIVVPGEGDDLADWLKANVIDYGAVGPIVKIAGVLSQRSPVSSNISSALEGRGLSRSPDPLYMTPFIDGRIPGLQSLIASSDLNAVFSRMIAGFIVLIGVAKRVFSILWERGRSRSREALFEGLDPDAELKARADADIPSALPTQSAPVSAAADSPLARVAERDAAARAARSAKAASAPAKLFGAGRKSSVATPDAAPRPARSAPVSIDALLGVHLKRARIALIVGAVFIVSMGIPPAIGLPLVALIAGYPALRDWWQARSAPGSIASAPPAPATAAKPASRLASGPAPVPASGPAPAIRAVHSLRSRLGGLMGGGVRHAGRDDPFERLARQESARGRA